MSCGSDTTNNRPIGIGYSDGQANSLAELLNVNVSSVSAVSITPTGGTLYVYGTLSAASFSGLPVGGSTNPAGSVGEIQLHGPGTVFSSIPNITVTGGTTLVSVQNVFTNVTATTETITTANIATANLTGTVNGLSFSGSLSDVTITSPANGQAACWNGTAWVNSSIPGAGITAISAATDVTVTTPADGHVLVWNGSIWRNLASSVLTGTAGGSTTQVQFNNAGILSGTSNLVFTAGTGLLQASTLSATNF